MAAIERDGGRPCGCDPSTKKRGFVKGHVCEEHARVEDPDITTVGVEQPIVEVRGPVNGYIQLRAEVGEQLLEFWFDRFEAEDLVNDITRRLATRG